MKNKYRSW